METNFEFKYRIVYESLSRFSSNLAKCSTFESVAQCLRADVKYILDFIMLRFSFFQPGLTVSYTLNDNECRLEKYNKQYLWEEDEILFDQKVPTMAIADDSYVQLLQGKDIFLTEQPQHIWSWSYNFQQTSGIIVTLVTSEKKTFSTFDVPILKLVAENLYSKLFSLKLIQDFDIKKSELEHALLQLKEINETMKDVVRRQDALIEERTAELKEKNRKLLELSKLNAHNVREPLSRILGILDIINDCSNEEIQHKWLPMINKSSEDLDKSLNEAILFIDMQLKRTKNYD